LKIKNVYREGREIISKLDFGLKFTYVYNPIVCSSQIRAARRPNNSRACGHIYVPIAGWLAKHACGDVRGKVLGYCW
jgi:hypothetical protein